MYGLWFNYHVQSCCFLSALYMVSARWKTGGHRQFCGIVVADFPLVRSRLCYRLLCEPDPLYSRLEVYYNL